MDKVRHTLELQHQHLLAKSDDVIPPIVINSTFRGGQNNAFVVPLHRNSIHGQTYNGKNNFGSTQYPVSTYGIRRQRNDAANRIGVRNDVTENERIYTSISAKNHFSSPNRPKYSPKGLAFAPGFYCRKLDTDNTPQQRFGSSFSKSSGNIKFHSEKDRQGNGSQQFSNGIVGTVLTGNGTSKLTYYQANDLGLDYSFQNTYKQQRRVCSALASKRKVPGINVLS